MKKSEAATGVSVIFADTPANRNRHYYNKEVFPKTGTVGTIFKLDTKTGTACVSWQEGTFTDYSARRNMMRAETWISLKDLDKKE